MEKHTITEALAEIKLIDKRVEKKHAYIKENLLRFDHLPDPFVKEGGSTEHLRRENQAIHDLWARLVKLRAAITKANVENSITIEGITKTIAEWLAWKKNVQDQHLNHLNQLIATIQNNRRENERTPKFGKDETGNAFVVKMTFNMDIAQLQRDLEQVMAVKERLDGQLSLKNATIVVAID